MKKIKFSKVIEGYEDVVIEELAARCKDVIYKKAEDVVERGLEKLKDLRVTGDDTLEMNYRIIFVVNDITQLIGRIEREGTIP